MVNWIGPMNFRRVYVDGERLENIIQIEIWPLLGKVNPSASTARRGFWSKREL
jgi:hypothetical protein